MHAKYLDVVAAVLFDRDGRVLLTQRPRGKPLAGLWEFPGGKRNQGETPLAALARELREELGIEINDARPLLRTCHQDTAPALRLDTWRIDTWSGEPAGLEQQALAWVPVDELERWPMPGPDRPIISALRLPQIYAITPEPDHRDFLVLFEHLLKRLTATASAQSPTRLVQMR